MRWLMLCLTQEFPLITVQRIWDSFLSHPKKQKFTEYMCLAILQQLRPQLLKSDFAEIM